MSLQIESAKNLQEFVNFANYKRDDGDAIAQFSLASGSTLRQITATDQDHIRRLGNLGCHGDENAAANNRNGISKKDGVQICEALNVEVV